LEAFLQSRSDPFNFLISLIFEELAEAIRQAEEDFNRVEEKFNKIFGRKVRCKK